MRDEESSTNLNAARESETRLELLYEIGRILTISKTVNAAVSQILEAVCRGLQFEVGELWILDEAENRLKLKSGWHLPAAPLERFAVESQSFEFSVGEGLPGNVWRRNAPIWIEKLKTEGNLARLPLAERAGLQSAFAFPIKLGEKFLGAFCFFCCSECPHDEKLLEMFAAVGGSVGQLIERERVEKNLRESDAVMQTINQSSPTLIYLKDRAGRMLNANPATLEVIGKPLAEILGKTHGEYTGSESEGAAIAGNDRRIVEGGATETFEEKVLTRGVLRTFLSTKTPYRDEHGEIIGLVGVSFDITTRKQAETRLALLAEISELISTVENTEELLFAVSEKIGEHLRVRRCLFNEIDLERDVETVHRDYCRGVASVAGRHRISDYSPITSAEMMGGRTVVNADSKTDARTAEDYEKTYAPAGERAYVAVPLLRENRWVASLWVSDDEPRRWSKQAVSLLETVAERAWTAVEKLRIDVARQEAEAERELMFVEAQKAREVAERANHSKDEFIALVSHELRSPLNAMLGWTRILQRKQADEKTTEYALDVIVRNALSQSRLIEDLLDIARIGEGKLRIEVRATTIIPIIKAAIEITKPAADGKNIGIVESLDPAANFIHGDDDRLRQIVENLLSNAVKFTPGDGKIEIVLSRNEKNVQLVISDTGQGITAEFLPEIFERFRQADPSTTRRHGGLGIGLSLARDLVELHGGTISAESEGEGAGATFIVTLPLRTVLPIKQNSDLEEAMSSQGKLNGFWILAVDDEADAREIVSFMLQINGAKVTTANSAVEALEILKGADGRIPDILLSDISMPFESGYALLEKIRALPREHGGEIPAVALTAFNRPEDREAAFEAGFQKHLGKPVDMDALIDAIVETARAKQI